MSGQRRRSAGFSLLELVLALAILGILAAVGFVNFRSLDTRSRVRRGAQEIAREFDNARLQARRTNGAVSLDVYSVKLPETAILQPGGPPVVTFEGPFGTVSPDDVYGEGNRWVTYSIASTRDASVTVTVTVAGIMGTTVVR